VTSSPPAAVKSELPRRLDGLVSDNERTRGISTFEIGKLGPDAASAVPLLAQLLVTDHNLDVRWSAAWAFGKLGPSAVTAMPALARGIAHDRDPDVRAQAAWALGRIAGAEASWAETAVQILRRALNDSDSLVREEAAAALAQLGTHAKPALAELTRCVQDRHPLVRERALEAINASGVTLDSRPG
jgi:HEAT repeat protein